MDAHAAAPDNQGLYDLLMVLARHWRALVGGALAVGLLTLGVTFLIKPTFTARTLVMPPQQQQSSAAAALSQLGALAGLAGGLGNVKSPADQYVALMQSATVGNRIVDQFKLMQVYDVKYRQDALKELASNVRIAVGKKDGLLSVEVDDHEPRRAADMANAYVEGLRYVTTSLAVTEAQQRRAFFEQQLKQTQQQLTKAQLAMQSSGIDEGTLKAEPKAAAEGYARLRAETTAAEVRLQTLQRMMSNTAPEVMQQQATVGALRAELVKAERRGDQKSDSDYVSKYREFKYQETLFELFAKQFELAKVDESREGALIQVVDSATPPEKKSRPRRGLLAAGATLLALLAGSAFVVLRESQRAARRR